MTAASSALADAAALGLPALAEVLTRTEDGICVVDAGRRYVYAGRLHAVAIFRGYGFPDASRSREAWTAGSVTLDEFPGGDVLLARVTL